MGQGENGYHEWTEEELVRETISNLESLEGIYSVEWVTQRPYATIDKLIRIRTHRGSVIRLAIHYRLDKEEAELFDNSFTAG